MSVTVKRASRFSRCVAFGGLIVMIAAASSCSSATSPGGASFDGTFDLVSFNGTLPAVIYAGLPGTYTHLAAGSLTVQSRGRVLDVRTYKEYTANVVAITATDSTASAYTVEGARILLKRDAIAGQTVHYDTATLSGDNLLVTLHQSRGLNSPSGVAVYRRR